MGGPIKALTVPLIGASLLASCSYSYPVEVTIKHGEVVFDVDQKLDGCLSFLNIVDLTSGSSVWRLEREDRTNSCQRQFPIAYGRAPEGLREVKKAKPLRPGVLYRIEGFDPVRYYGAFNINSDGSVSSQPEMARAP